MEIYLRKEQTPKPKSPAKTLTTTTLLHDPDISLYRSTNKKHQWE